MSTEHTILQYASTPARKRYIEIDFFIKVSEEATPAERGEQGG